MLYTSPALETLIERFSALPTIGRKTAQRLALYLLKQPNDEIEQLADALIQLKLKVRACTICSNITEEDPCPICRDPRRNRTMICVVEEPNDVLVIERTNEFRGLYHVLGGTLSPLDGIGPEDIKVRELLMRVGGEESQVTEVIVALDSNVEGEATTLYLAKLLHPLVGKVTRIARGIPIGSDLEFVDDATLAKAFEGRLIV
ncbi:MAG TPA: recombination mediator RecR [Candidatus Kapabacteria bacterium]